MSITCLNLKNEVVKRNFDELASIVGADRAETLLVKNNGYSLDRIPDGTVRDRYLELMDKTNQNRRFVLKKIADELRDGNVIADNYETKEIFGNIPYRGDYMENRRDDEEIIDDDKINLSPEELSRLEEMQIMDYLDEEEQRKELEKYEREHPEEQALVNQRFSGKKEVTVEEFIKNALADDSDYSIILNNLLPNLGALKGIKVILGNRNLLMSGLYSPEENTISIFNRKIADKVFVHELIHAIVHNNKNKDKYKGRFTKLYEKLKKTVFEQYGISSYNEITSPKLKTLLYGFKSEDEFISEFYSSRAFNTLVKTTEKSLSKVRNIGIVDKIIKFVEEVLGIKFDTKATRLVRKIVSSFDGGIIDERTSLQTYSKNRKTNKSFSYNNIDKITAKKILYETYLKGQPLYLEPEDISHDLSEYRRFYKLYPKGRTTEDMSVDDAIRNIKQYFSTLEFVDKYGMLHPIKPVAKQRKNPIYEQVKKWINEMSEQDLIAEAWRIVLEENEDYELYEPQDIPTFNYTEGQKKAIDGILNKIKNREGDILLTGRAGTGKTTIINDIIRNLTPTRPVIVSAVAHQAKTNLLNKINPDVKKTHDIKGYSVAALLGDESTYDDNGRISFVRGNRESPISRASLIIIDEASMLNEEQLEKLLTLRDSTNAVGAPILFIADEAQVNPIRSDAYMKKHSELVGGELSPIFTNESIIKKDNKFELTEIVRQKGSSPILDYAARYSDFNLGLVKEYPNDAEFQSSDESQLAFFNNMNEVLNQPAIIEEYLKALETKNPYHINIFAYTKAAVNKYNEAIQARLFDVDELDALRENGIMFHDDELVVAYDNIVIPYEDKALQNSSRAFIKLVRDKDEQVEIADMPFSFNDAEGNLHTFYIETYKVKGQFDNFPKPITLTLPTLTPENVKKIQEAYNVLLKDALNKKARRMPASWADFYSFINKFCLSGDVLSESKRNSTNLTPYDASICNIRLGYALTIHKAQGSTYDISIVDKDDIISKSRIGIEASRLLYTGVTRASKTAYVVGNTNNSAIETKISDQMLASEANTIQKEIDKIISHIQQMDRDLLTQKVNSKDLDLLDKLTALRAQGISINTYISNFNGDFKKQFISLLQSLVSDLNKAVNIPVNLEVEMHKAETLLKNETTPEAQSQTQKEKVIQQHKGDWTRKEAENNPKTLYVFTDNTDRDSGSGIIPADSWYSKKYGTGHHYPTMTAAVVRGLDNARPISTQRWYHQGAKGATGRWTDNDVEEFKTIIREELQEIVNEFNTGKYDTIMFPDGDGLFNTKISNITKDRTPKLYQVLADLLHEFGFDALIPSDAISNSQQQQTTLTIHSGGAPGADKIWGDIGQLYGAKVNHYYHGERSEKNAPYGNVEISEEDYNEGKFEVAKAAARNWGYEYSAMKDDRLIRDWAQVKYADTVIAIGTIAQPGEKAFPDKSNDSRTAVNPMVTGGTGYAVGMAILHNKPVYVFNQKDGKWYIWDNVIGNFAETDVPKLTENTACIGSRNITNSGVKAIEDVFQKSFPELDKSILKYTSLLSDGKVQASSLTEEQKQNVVADVEKSIDFGKHTLTEQEVKKQADFKAKYPEVYYKAISRKELLSMKNMSRKAISSVAKAFSYTLLDKLDSILYNEDELEELKENYPTIFTDKVVDALYRNKKFTNDQSALYRLAIKEIGSSNIINMVLDELDAYSENDYDGNFNYNSSLCQKDDEGNPIFRISYLDFINPILKSISGLEFSDGLNLKETTENKKIQDDESDQFDEAESLEDDNENNTMFTFSINNLTRGFTKNLDYKIKNAFARIQMRDNEGIVKLDKFGNPLYYKKETISNGIFKAVKNCQTFDEMRDAIENSKLPFKDQVLDIISNNPSLKTLFVKNFNKHNVSYGVTRTGEKTAIRYEPTNYSAKAEILRIKGLARLKGSKNSEFAMFLYNDRRDPSAVYVNEKALNVYASIFRDLNATKDMVIHIAYEKALQNDPTLKYEDFKENQFDIMDLFVGLSKVLTKFMTDAGIIDMTVDELITFLQADDKNFGLLILGIQKCIKQLGGKFPFSGKGSILYSYRKVQNLLQDYVLSYSDPAIHFNGKTYSTTIYPCYLSQVFKKLHSDEREQFLEDTYWSVRYFGKFRNEPWFKSWLTDLEGGSPIEFVPILAHNSTSYTDLDPTQFIEMALCNYICLNDYKQAPYVMPIMSDKSMGGTITGKIFEIGSSEFSDRLFTVFMQELDRIKQVYNRALLRKGYIKNFDTILDDNKHIAFTNKANVGGGEFKLLNFLNPILEGINKPREEQTEFQRILSDYIYGDVELSELTSQYGDLDSLYEKIKDFAVSAIEEGLLNEYMEWYNDLEESGMIDHLTKAIKSDSTNNRQPITDDFLMTFFFNDFYARTQILQLLTGDITFYDNWNDLQKRIAEFISPGLKYDLTARDFSGELYSRTGKKRAMIISDFKGFLPQTKVIDSVYAIKERELKNRAKQANKGVLSELDKKNIEHQIAEEKAGFRKIDTTDGQGLLSLTGLRKHLGMLGIMPEGFEAFYNRVLEDVVYEKDPRVRKENWNEIKEEFPYLSFEIIKQFTYGIVKVDDTADSKSNIAIPTQVKNAEAPIVDFDSILESEDQTLFTLLEFMEKNDIDVIYTNSNVKVGGIRTTDLTKCTTQDQVKNVLEENVANPEYIIEMDYSNISEQQPGLKHYEDFSADVGAQLQKILVGMLNDAMMRNEQYTLNQYQTHTNGKLRENPSKVTLTARQLLDLYNNVLAEIHNINCNELMSSLGIDNALFNKILDRNGEFTPEEVMKLNTKLSNVLSKQLENDANPNPMLIDAFSPTTTGDFQFPLNDVSLFSQMQKTLMSIIKKAATTTELSGGQLVQETDMIRLNIINKENPKAEGDDSLHIIYEDADGTLTAFPMKPVRIAHFEVKLPYYMKSMYENYKDQKDVPEELRKLICYRIPTEGACSMFPIKVVGFTSKASGGKIKMPAEITEIAGVDFDIDKMFFIAPACNKDGEYIEYDSAWGSLGRSTSVKGMSMDQLNNMFLDITWSTLTSPASLTSQLSTSSFKKFIKNSQIMQIIKYHQANNTGRASEENIVDLYNELYNKSSDELKAEVDKISAAKSICSFATQAYLHNRNMTSAQEIGVFAIGRSAASILTNAHVKLLNTFGGQTLFGKKLGESVELNKFLSNDDIIPIVDMIREGLAAAVDGAKSPVLSDCGFNMCLINIAMPMFYMGFSVDQIVLVLTQPITQEIAREFYRQKNNFEHPNALNVVNGFIEQLSKEGFPFMGQSLINITKTSLIQGLSQKVVLNRDDFTISKESSSADQLQLLYLLNNLFIAADTIRNMVACVRIDQKSNSNYQNVFDLISTLLVVDNTINEAKNSEKQKKSAENEGDDFSVSTSCLSKEFAEIFDLDNADYRNTNLISVRTNLKKMLYGIFGYVNPSILDFYENVVSRMSQEARKNFSSEELETMYHEYVFYNMINLTIPQEGSSLIPNTKDLSEFFGWDFPEYVSSIKPTLLSDETLRDNLFLKYLRVSNDSYEVKSADSDTGTAEEVTIKTVKINTFGMPYDTQVELSNDWLELLNSSNSNANRLGKLCVFYSLFRNGGKSGKGSFLHLLPTEFKYNWTAYKNFLENSANYFTGADPNDFFKLYLRHHPELVYKANPKTVKKQGSVIKDLKIPNNEKPPVVVSIDNKLFQKDEVSGSYTPCTPLGGAVLEYSSEFVNNPSNFQSGNLKENGTDSTEVPSEQKTTNTPEVTNIKNSDSGISNNVLNLSGLTTEQEMKIKQESDQNASTVC